MEPLPSLEDYMETGSPGVQLPFCGHEGKARWATETPASEKE